MSIETLRNLSNTLAAVCGAKNKEGTGTDILYFKEQNGRVAGIAFAKKNYSTERSMKKEGYTRPTRRWKLFGSLGETEAVANQLESYITDQIVEQFQFTEKSLNELNSAAELLLTKAREGENPLSLETDSLEGYYKHIQILKEFCKIEHMPTNPMAIKHVQQMIQNESNKIEEILHLLNATINSLRIFETRLSKNEPKANFSKSIAALIKLRKNLTPINKTINEILGSKESYERTQQEIRLDSAPRSTLTQLLEKPVSSSATSAPIPIHHSSRTQSAPQSPASTTVVSRSSTPSSRGSPSPYSRSSSIDEPVAKPAPKPIEYTLTDQEMSQLFKLGCLFRQTGVKNKKENKKEVDDNYGMSPQGQMEIYFWARYKKDVKELGLNPLIEIKNFMLKLNVASTKEDVDEFANKLIRERKKAMAERILASSSSNR